MLVHQRVNWSSKCLQVLQANLVIPRGGIHIPKECRSKGVARRLAPEMIQAGWWLSPTPLENMKVRLVVLTKCCCFSMKNGGLTII